MKEHESAIEDITYEIYQVSSFFLLIYLFSVGSLLKGSLSDLEMRQYHHKLQLFPYFFIDSANAIDNASLQDITSQSAPPVDPHWHVFIMFAYSHWLLFRIPNST